MITSGHQREGRAFDAKPQPPLMPDGSCLPLTGSDPPWSSVKLCVLGDIDEQYKINVIIYTIDLSFLMDADSAVFSSNRNKPIRRWVGISRTPVLTHRILDHSETFWSLPWD